MMPPIANGTTRKAEILRCAAALFAANGVQATTMGSVAAAVGIKKASLYYFFASKEDLVGEIIRPAVQAMYDEIDAIAASDDPPDVKLRLAIGALAHAFDTYGDEMVILVRERLHVIVKDATYQQIRQLKARYTSVWRRIIEDGQTSGVFTPGDSRLRAFAMIGALNWMYAWYDPATHELDAVIHTFTTVLCAGMLAER